MTTTFDRTMALYWCLLPVQLAFAWLDVSRQRAPHGTWRRAVAARRQLWLAPGSAASYAAGFAAVTVLLGRVPGLDDATRLLGLASGAALLVFAWRDAQRVVDAWHDSGLGRWWRRLRSRLGRQVTLPQPRPAFTA